MAWNYRVLNEIIDNNGEKLERFRVVEVYYNEAGEIDGWVDCTDTILDFTGEFAYDDLKKNAELVLHAFNKPVLSKGENDKLYEEK
jgi:hypothetical protein